MQRPYVLSITIGKTHDNPISMVKMAIKAEDFQVFLQNEQNKTEKGN